MNCIDKLNESSSLLNRRRELEQNIADILLELTDIGYRSFTSGWVSIPSKPYVWISNRIKPNGIDRYYVDESVVKDVVDRLEDYLSSEGLYIKIEKLYSNVNKNSLTQIYIFFNDEIITEKIERFKDFRNRRKVKIRKVSDKSYNWSPSIPDKGSPAPIDGRVNIKPI